MIKVLFICTHNRCRSQLCEALLNQMAPGRVKAFSAGSQPVSEVHPNTLRFLAEKDIATVGLKSQSWDEFSDLNPDIVFTVCDSAAAESCPVWMGKTVKVHWGLPDPSKVEGTDAEVSAAFHGVIAIIERRLTKMLALDLEGLTQAEASSALQQALQAIAEED